MNIKFTGMIVILVFFLGCFQNQNTEYKYSDGSGNLYIINKSSIKYIPISEPMSSSGLYSGGEKKTIVINNKQYNEITALLKKAIKKKSIHIKNRIKTSGSIYYSVKNNKHNIFLKTDSELNTKIESFLKFHL